jgi:uncharacterized membrane protein
MAKEDTSGLWRGVLVASLAVNLLVVGIAAGWWLRHGGAHHGAHPSRLDMAGGPLTRALSAAERHEIAREMRAAWRAQGGGRDAMRESMEALLVDLRAQPFEPARVAARLAAQRAAFAARFELGQQVLVAHLGAMSAAERAAFADRLEAQIAAYRGHHDD